MHKSQKLKFMPMSMWKKSKELTTQIYIDSFLLFKEQIKQISRT